MGRIFISYRRQDAAAAAGLLRDRLAARYGDRRVFLDLDLAPGADFARQQREAVESADTVLVVIGPQWLVATDAEGRRRLDDPQDFVRHEVAAALQLDKPVIPVLVENASLPRPEELPDDLRSLVDRQAFTLRYERFDSDVDHLVHQIGGTRRLASLRGCAPSLGGRATTRRRSQPGFGTRLVHAYRVLMDRPRLDRSSPVSPTSSSPLPTPGSDPSLGVAQPAQPAPPSYDVFVSHATEDQEFADDVVSAVERRGHVCWIAHRDIPPGSASWAAPIVTAIASSRLVLVLLTEESIGSSDILREVTLAADESIPLLGVCLDDHPLSPGLRYFFATAQRLELSHSEQADRLLRIVPAVEEQLPTQA